MSATVSPIIVTCNSVQGKFECDLAPVVHFFEGYSPDTLARDITKTIMGYLTCAAEVKGEEAKYICENIGLLFAFSEELYKIYDNRKIKEG